MAETPKFYMPDFKAQWGLVGSTGFSTEQARYRGGRRFRRKAWPQTIRTWRLQSAHVMLAEDRRALYDFFKARSGAAESFFFWDPSPRTLLKFATGKTFGTTDGSDGWHQNVPLKGPCWLGDAPTPATYQQLGSGPPPYFALANVLIVGASTQMCMQPRGNTYASFKFNGLNSYGNAGSAANVRMTGDQTWMAWVFPRPMDTGFVSNIILGNESFQASGIVFYLDSTRFARFRTSRAGASSEAVCDLAVPLNRWSHVAAVRSGTNVTFFVNGVQRNTVAGISNPVLATLSLYIGVYTDLATVFRGMLNEVRVYNAALSAQSILDQYNGLILFDYSGSLAGYWPITDGRGSTTFVDKSMNAYSATIANYSDDLWVGGEDEVVLPSSQAGALTLPYVQMARPRVTVTFGMDSISESFLADVADIRASYDILVEEAV